MGNEIKSPIRGCHREDRELIWQLNPPPAGCAVEGQKFIAGRRIGGVYRYVYVAAAVNDRIDIRRTARRRYQDRSKTIRLNLLYGSRRSGQVADLYHNVTLRRCYWRRLGG